MREVSKHLDEDVLTFHEFPDLWASLISASFLKYRRDNSLPLFRDTTSGRGAALQSLVENAVNHHRAPVPKDGWLSTLAKLDLSCCPRVDLTLVPGLTSLNLSPRCEIASVAVLVDHLPNLSELDIDECHTFSDLELLALLPLQRLSMRCLRAPKTFPCSLTSLDLQLATVEDWTFLSTLPHLTILNLSNCESVTDAVIQLLHPLSLRELLLTGNNSIRDSSIAHLTASTCGQSLRNINLQACEQLTDTSLKSLAEMRNLEMVSLEWNTQITDQGLCELRKLRSLRILYLGDCEQVSVEGLRELSTSLERLNLAGTVPEVDVAALLRFSGLQTLHLDTSDVDATGAALLLLIFLCHVRRPAAPLGVVSPAALGAGGLRECGR